MELDSKAIETLSVNAVKNSIVTTDFLDQFIAENDKEPSWDGFVYMYSNKSKKKSNFKGRMPVQVKGKMCDDHDKEIISYSMSTADLKSYLNDGGCILFVVYIGCVDLVTKIYYAELTPIKLRQILEDAYQQDWKSVKLREFPCDNNKKCTIFFNCLQNCQKQASFKDGKLFTLEELEEQGVLENIVIPVSGVGINDPQMALINNEVYVYARIKGSSIPQPLYDIPKEIHTKENIDALITIEGRVFYTRYSVTKSAKKIVLCFGESFTVEFDKNKQCCKINYKNSDNIRVLAKDLDFMISYLEYGYFKVGDEKLPLDSSGTDLTDFDISKEKENLEFVNRIVEVLDILRCPEDINIKDMNDEDWRNLNRLIVAFWDGKPVKGLKEDLPPLVFLKVGKLRFAVCLQQCEEKGSYIFYDFFKKELPVAFEDQGKMFPISQYAILQKKELLTVSNIDFDGLLPSFQNVTHHCETYDRANCFFLEMLNACDEAQGERKKLLLKTCIEFSEWLLEASEDELDRQVKLLNMLQTIKRNRDFNPDERDALYEMIENNREREDCLVGAYLLLGQQKAAERHFARLSEAEQQIFRKYPIYYFWDGGKINGQNENADSQ